jgi:hypothetical protein
MRSEDGTLLFSEKHARPDFIEKYMFYYYRKICLFQLLARI